jgi:hypothetical protein
MVADINNGRDKSQSDWSERILGRADRGAAEFRRDHRDSGVDGSCHREGRRQARK